MNWMRRIECRVGGCGEKEREREIGMNNGSGEFEFL